MSRLIELLPKADHIYEGNLCVIRNDLQEILWNQVFDEDTDISEYSRVDFEENLEDYRSAIRKGEEYASTLDQLGESAMYGGIFVDTTISLVSSLILKSLSLTAKEGTNLKLEIFERARYGIEDKPELEEVYYRDLYNRTLLKSSFLNRLIVVSSLLDVSPKSYRVLLKGLQRKVNGDSMKEISTFVFTEIQED